MDLFLLMARLLMVKFKVRVWMYAFVEIFVWKGG